MIVRHVPGTPWSIHIEPWQDGYSWRTVNSETGYTYSSVMYDSTGAAEMVALWHIVHVQFVESEPMRAAAFAKRQKAQAKR